MKDIHQIARLMKDLESRLITCMRCGMCQAVCPLYGETGLETDVARGKLSLLDGVLKENLKDAHGVQERLDRCLLCGSCASNCPSGVDVLGIFLRARQILNDYLGLPVAKKILLRKLLANPAAFNRAAGLGARVQGLVARSAGSENNVSCGRFFPHLLGNRHFPALAKKPFHQQQPVLNHPPAGRRPRVLFFTGCLMDKIYPEIAKAAVKVLAHHGFGIIIPADMACCGIPAAAAGDTDTFQKLVRHNLDLFSAAEADCVMTICATCTATIKHIWPKMMPQKNRQRARLLETVGEKTVDISQLLADHGCLTSSGGDVPSDGLRVTYHDPCHLKKSLGVAQQPRQAIRANRRYDLVEMDGADQCCGMGGSFNLEHYDLSKRIGRKKRDSIKATGAQIVATGCPACMLQLTDQLSQNGDKVRVKHFIEIYAEAFP